VPGSILPEMMADASEFSTRVRKLAV
jgi:hypothetical protein